MTPDPSDSTGPVREPAPAGDDALAAALRGFGPLGLAAIAVILLGNFLFIPLSALLILAWAHRARIPWRDLGYVRPRRWPLTVLAGIAIGFVFKLGMKAVVMPLLGADPINRAYHYLAGNSAALPGALYAMIVGAGFGEETLFRGYLFERLGRLLGTGPRSKALIVVLTAALFGIAHYPVQGLSGTQQATIVGLVYGAWFAATGRLLVLMVAHAAFDLTALAMIYWNLETWVSHLVFK